MNPFKSKLFFFLTLLLYTTILTAGLLYFRFPAKSFKLWCEKNLEQLLPATHCSIKTLQYSFPLGLAAKELQITSTRENAEELFFIDQMQVQGNPLALTSSFQVNMQAADGNHSFTLLRNRAKQIFRLEDIHIEHFNLEKAPFLHHIMRRSITGNLQMNGNYQGVWKNGTYRADGKGSVSVTQGSFDLLYPILSLEKIDLQTMQSDLVLQENSLHFANGTFHGKELTGTFTGNLGIQSDFSLSTFSFRGAIEPLPPLLTKSKYAQNMIIQLKKQGKRSSLPFRLQGTVEKPTFHFDS